MFAFEQVQKGKKKSISMMKVMNKLALVLALALCVSSVSAVHTEQRKVVLNQKLEADWKWEV